MTDHISYLGIGSNIETQSSSRFDFLSFAVRQLSQHEQITVTKASHVYETQPVGFSDQENFYNAALEVSTTLEPTAFLRICLDVVEKRAGRTRTIKDGPRTLDVDVLTFDDITLEEESLTIPSPSNARASFCDGSVS
jgi:2-amino-4-hydroxy-6-hydroxymethyldihydropteridine diphosphokinase